MIIKSIFIILLFFGVLLISLYYLNSFTNNTVYKYIPMNAEQINEDEVFVSDIYKDMFINPTPWIDLYRI